LCSFRLPFRITLKLVVCRSTLGHCSCFPKAKSPAGADPVRAWCAATQYLDRAPHLFTQRRPIGLYYNTRQAGGQKARFTELCYLRLAAPTAERLTVTLSQDGIKSAIQLTPS